MTWSPRNRLGLDLIFWPSFEFIFLI
jgi:hypothetical protein